MVDLFEMATKRRAGQQRERERAERQSPVPLLGVPGHTSATALAVKGVVAVAVAIHSDSSESFSGGGMGTLAGQSGTRGGGILAADEGRGSGAREGGRALGLMGGKGRDGRGEEAAAAATGWTRGLEAGDEDAPAEDLRGTEPARARETTGELCGLSDEPSEREEQLLEEFSGTWAAAMSWLMLIAALKSLTQDFFSSSDPKSKNNVTAFCNFPVCIQNSFEQLQVVSSFSSSIVTLILTGSSLCSHAKGT